MASNVSLSQLAVEAIIKGKSIVSLSQLAVEAIIGLDSVADPVIEPESGEYTSATTIEITIATPGATIYYTTDGTDPDETDNVYSDPIPMFAGTLKAIGIASGYGDSNIVSATYTISSSGNNPPILFIIT